MTAPSRVDDPNVTDSEVLNPTAVEAAVVEALEDLWWHLRPGEEGYDQPLYKFCGLTREQWDARRCPVLPVRSGPTRQAA